MVVQEIVRKRGCLVQPEEEQLRYDHCSNLDRNLIVNIMLCLYFVFLRGSCNHPPIVTTALNCAPQGM